MSDAGRRRGRKLMLEECALIDTSNRTKNVNEKSVLALASRKPLSVTILLLSKDKKVIYQKLEAKHDKNKIPAIMHSVKIYYALKEFIDIIPAVYICADGCNKSHLEHHLKQIMGTKYDKLKIHIWSSLKNTFGKKNIADRLANKVRKNNTMATITLKESDFKRLKLID